MRPAPDRDRRYAVALARELAALEGLAVRPMCRFSRWRKRTSFPMPCGLFLDRVRPILRRYDLFHATGVRLPAWSRPPLVATVHDVFHLLDHSRSWGGGGFRERTQGFYHDTAGRAARMIAVSESTRRDWIERLAFPAERIDVAHLGVDPGFAPRPQAEIAPVLAALGVPQDYLLYVGAWAIRKNLPRMVRAYQRCAAGGDLALVIAGPPAEDEAAVRAAISALPPGRRVVLLDYPSDEQIRVLYAGAAALLFATLYEGFGLPILEAMSSGCPVVAADCGAAPEIAGGHAALADPGDEEAIAAAIGRALAMSPPQRAAARAHAAAFTWRRCAESTLRCYQRVAE